MNNAAITTPEPASVLSRLRRRTWADTILRASAVAALLAAVSTVFLDGPLGPGLVAAGSWALVMITGVLGRAHRVLDLDRLARHLDRCFPELEESSSLLVLPPDQPSTLQRLQQQRIAPRWPELLAETQRWLPPLRWRTPALLLVTALLIVVMRPFIDPATAPLLPSGASAPGADVAAVQAGPELINITITPPAYMGLPQQQQEDFELDVPQGSLVSWSVQWSGSGQAALVINDGRELSLSPMATEGNRLRFEHVADRTALYRFTQAVPTSAGDSEKPPAQNAAEVHTLSVQLDRPPVLRIIEPTVTTLELARNAVPEFVSQVQVRDDHGIAAVEIRASVAKGSGEGVKFRDEVFQFDRSTIDDDSVIYTRQWSLEQLGMEPGDEVYFFAVATDNREPEPNEARSDTVVVRWLDDVEPLGAADGLAIDVLPEYYKSQRQIIIETERLIADRDALNATVFEETSRGLAQAQAELKERYGQYLGDEFEEGDGASFAASAVDALEDQNDDGHEEDGDEHADHHHESAAAAQVNTQGGAAELIERFAHNHGAAEIGPITRRNPVGLMKRSISNMWQSELHLHLAEPEKALPFAYEALKYLDLARQADRIYTRRLGFEPPPVTEERRLTGELVDIVSRVRRQSPNPDADPARMAEALYAQLGALRPDQPIPPATRELLRRAAGYLTTQAQQRPALIAQAVNIERLLQADRANPVGCERCTSELRETAWSLIAEARAAPDRRPASAAADSSPAAAYQESLRRLRAGQSPP